MIQPPFFALAVGFAFLSGCGGSSANTASGKFALVNLVADTAGPAAVTDANLVNAWGISMSPTGSFWISDNGSGKSTLYNGSGAITPLVVASPAAGGGSNGPVTGQVYNGTSDFVVPTFGPSNFIFANEDGVISAWYSGSNAVTVNDQSGTGAVYKGLAKGVDAAANFLYAANFHSGMVDVFDKNFVLTKSFTDATLPAGYAPFGIQNINGLLYVSFALQNPAKHDDVSGPGHGYIDVYNTNGTLNRRLVSTGALNSPWGLVQAPAGFGSVGNALLVGNFGDGKINAYNISTGASIGPLNGTTGTPLIIDGLWGLTFGNGSGAGSTTILYFTAGPVGESHGLFGSLTPSP